MEWVWPGWARATVESGNPPYWMFRQVVRALDPGRLTGDLAVVGGDASGDDRSGEDRGEDRVEERFRVFQAVTALIPTLLEEKWR